MRPMSRSNTPVTGATRHPSGTPITCKPGLGIVSLKVRGTTCVVGRAVSHAARLHFSKRIRSGGKLWQCTYKPSFDARCTSGTAAIWFHIYDGPV